MMNHIVVMHFFCGQLKRECDSKEVTGLSARGKWPPFVCGSAYNFGGHCKLLSK